MASAVTPFYKSIIQIGSFTIPMEPGATQITAPRNWVVPPIIGNYWQLNKAPGLVQPVVDVSLILLDDPTYGVTASFLNLFTTRSGGVDNDTTAISSGIMFWNGRQGFRLDGAKADSFMIRCSAGEKVTLRARFCGSGLTPLGADVAGLPTHIAAPSPILFSAARILSWVDVTFDSTQNNKVWSFNLSYSNNHNPDLSMNGTIFPSAQNAGELTAGYSVTVQASDGATVGALSAATVNIVGTTGLGMLGTRSLVLPNLVCNTDLNIPITAPRNMMDLIFVCLGTDGTTTPPFQVAS